MNVHQPAAAGGPGFRSSLWAMVAGIAVVAAILGMLVHLGVHQQIVTMLRWFDDLGAWAGVLFIAVMVLVVVFLLPGLLFTTGAGFVFGVVEGSIYVVVGTTIGATLSFLIARYLLGERARRYVVRHARVRVVSEELTPRGWKIVLLTRLIPFFPSKLSNYFFGLAGFSLRGFVGGSALGFIPYSVHNVYLGSLAADLATLGERPARSPIEWGIYLTGFVATAIAVIWLSRLAQRAIHRYESQGFPGEDAQ